MVSDYFVMVRGDWMPNGKKLFIISVYAPQELYEKKMLWDYLSLVMSRWEGEVVIMGDFNEVRNKSESFGMLFNRRGVDVVNRFISNAGLEEVSLEGCSFTWCHRSATKMSKLDHFLISDSLLCSCLDIASITLHLYLSDHRPILMRGVYYDYGPAKIKWAIEGDKNSKYYHGVINKKRNQLSIRGILVEGTWIDSPSLVKDAVTCFFHQGSFPKGGNYSFIILIPKTLNANIVKDYRPITLIRSMYKIISKIMANRLVVVLGGLVNEIQLAFVADKQILDDSFILNELVQRCKKKKKQSLVFKVDFRKAYESVRWDHLDNIMRKFGFGEKWCMRIQSSLRSSSGSVIMNGSPTKEFLFYKGLKQVLDCFNHASGLQINMTKSKLLGISVEDDKVKQVAAKIGCNTLKTPFSYLGLKVGGCMSRIQSWNETIERMAYKGGLGVSSLFALNRALMFKWVWRFITQGSSLWARVIKALHGYDGKIGQKVKSYYPLLWLDIIHEVEMFKSRGIDLVSLIHSKFGLYEMETQKKIDVASKLSHSGLDVSFCLPPRGGVEIQQFENMKEKVEGRIVADMMNRWFWALEGSGEFTIMSVRKLIDDIMLPKVSTKTCRIKLVPIKMNEEKESSFIEELDVQPINSLITIFGDIHGQFHDLMKLFRTRGHVPDINYIFMGDFVDSGYNNLEVFTILLLLKASHLSSRSKPDMSVKDETLSSAHSSLPNQEQAVKKATSKPTREKIQAKETLKKVGGDSENEEQSEPDETTSAKSDDKIALDPDNTEQTENSVEGACSTLFIANLGPKCSEAELRLVLSKVSNRGAMPVTFADFKEVEKATEVMNALEGSMYGPKRENTGERSSVYLTSL
nr:RNA-directed DNA polymerase, eukaryota, reverse transcriptase zinc-binding domain protein [Tanacetum cinerariifolium]